jgi:hypothetical protein
MVEGEGLRPVVEGALDLHRLRAVKVRLWGANTPMKAAAAAAE